MAWLISKALLDRFENSHSSRAQGAASSGARSSAGKPSQPLNGCRAPQAYWCSDRTMESWSPSLFGMTSEPLTADRGADLLTWFQEDFLARTSALPEREPDSLVRAPDYGVRWRELSMKYSPDTCMWRTPPSLWDEGWTWSLGTLPKWGSMLDGELWEQVTSVPPINAIARGFLPTPVTYDTTAGRGAEDNYHGLGWQARYNWTFDPDAGRVPHIGLKERMVIKRAKAAQYPTPVAHEDRAANYSMETSYKHFATGSHQVHLSQMVRDPRMLIPRMRVPTPTATQPMMPFQTLQKRMTVGKRKGTTSVPLVEVLQRHALAEWEQRFPTPTATNGLRNSGKGGPTDGSEHQPMMWQSKGHPEFGELNPEWVEWLMGWPIGWTSTEPLSAEVFDDWAHANAGREDGTVPWWDLDPSEIAVTGEDVDVNKLTDDELRQLPRLIPKTVKRGTEEEENVRKARITALGNGQVPACMAGSMHLMVTWRMPKEEE